MSVVLAIIAIITAGTFSMGSSVLESARIASTNNKLDTIETALMAFRLANNRLPCPGDATLTDTPANAATYGYEANNVSGTCTGGSPAANYSYTLPSPPANTNIRGGTAITEGAVPVRTLGLPDEFQFDGWGRKFAYAAWTPLTNTNAFITYGVSPSCGAITAENAGHGYRTADGAYALISYGPDGHGGYLQSGSRYFMGSDNADEWTNCHCNASANVANTSGNAPATYVEQEATQSNSSDPLSVFDDIVRFKDRWQMQNAYDTYAPSGIPCWLGFRVDGVNSSDEVGNAVAVGDVNGDGIPDLIIGAPGAAGGAGAVYVVFGTKLGFPDPLPLNSLNGSNGFELDGASYEAGISVAAGDVNGDGVDDIIIAASSSNSYSMNSIFYVVFGGPTRQDGTSWASCPCTLNPAFLNGTNGAAFATSGSGPIYGYSTGYNKVAVADVNGDGIGDLIFGMGVGPYPTYGGTVDVVFGRKSGWSGTTTTLDSSFINGVNGVEFDGIGSDAADGYDAGYSVAAGDVNGDGISDLIIGAPDADPDGNRWAGSVYVVFGKKCGGSFTACSPAANTLNSTFLNGTNGIEFDGAATNEYAGSSVAAGDVNGDGISDVSIDAPGAAGGSGAVYVVFGKQCGGSFVACSPAANTLNSAFLNGANGVEFDGVSGTLVVDNITTGDINGDGIPDLIIGAPPATAGGTGAVYVVFGKKCGGGSYAACSPAANALLSGSGNVLDGSNGFQLNLQNSSLLSLAAGDINGDGIADLAIGSSYDNATYIYFGHKTTPFDPWPTSAYNLGGL